MAFSSQHLVPEATIVQLEQKSALTTDVQMELTVLLPTCALLQIVQSVLVVNIVNDKASVLGQVIVMQGISV